MSMPDRDATYRIDPIEPSQIGARFSALMARLEPVLDPDDVTAIRILTDEGDLAAAFELLDAITDAATTDFGTATLVELVLIGQALQAD
jgi:hypothetical protein